MKALIASLLAITIAAPTYALEFEFVEGGHDSLVILRGTGEVEYDDDQKIRDIADSIEYMRPGARMHVILESPGGSMIGGIRLGEAFRELDVSTGVAEDTICASACATAWFGGTKDGAPHAYRHPTALIGLHQPARKSGLPVTEAEAYEAAGTLAIYWSKVDANVEVLGVMLRTPNDSMTWLPYQVPSHNQ